MKRPQTLEQRTVTVLSVNQEGLDIAVVKYGDVQVSDELRRR